MMMNPQAAIAGQELARQRGINDSVCDLAVTSALLFARGSRDGLRPRMQRGREMLGQQRLKQKQKEKPCLDCTSLNSSRVKVPTRLALTGCCPGWALPQIFHHSPD